MNNGSCGTNEDNEPENFLFNNHQREKGSLKYKRALKTAWEQTEDSFNDFFSSLKELNKESLMNTESVMKESIRLEACILNLQNRIEFIECKSKELTHIQKALEKNQEKIKRNENFTFTVTKYYKEKVPIENASWWDRKVTSCTVCEENCHKHNCWSALDVEWCEVMSNNHCTICTGKCHYSKHVKENKKYVRLSKEILVTFDDLKKQHEGINNSASDIKFDSKCYEKIKNKIEINKKQEEEKTSTEKRLKEELSENEKEKSKLVEDTYNTIMKLSEIALKPDSAFIVQALDFLILRAEETGKMNCAKKLRELRQIPPESEERVKAVMSHLGPHCHYSAAQPIQTL
ncbi:uncharacterized protein LOC113648513 [Tachysurus fulvidraco]|uniref:uncharacterized protein LOC113648513 n=1 Tax=Tachysurus fulvidraco TaxID=1234273 RepID=UPI001FEE7C1F|nr:uncharacterized protein LOC113648513 [Tachysurus fulvidraco]